MYVRVIIQSSSINGIDQFYLIMFVPLIKLRPILEHASIDFEEYSYHQSVT